VPVGQPLPTKVTTTGVAIVTDTDSTGGAIANEPFAWNGWYGQVRVAAEAVGGLLSHTGWGASTLTGDGLTAVDRSNVDDLCFTDMGAPAEPVLISGRVPNDPRYFGLGGRNHPTPSEYGTFLGDRLDATRALRPALKAFVFNPPFPLGTAQVGPNFGNYFRQLSDGVGAGQYYTTIASVIAARATWCFGVDCSDLVLTTDYVSTETLANKIHPNQIGQNKITADVLSALRAHGVSI
jgi:hypothetical protein